jgi:hypothetical protein
MNEADYIKERLSMREVVEYYGFNINRSGYIQCPFHNEKTASLKVYESRSGHTGWHCFGCGVGGSSIDFAMKLFNLSYRQALLRLDTDFRLGLYSVKADRAEQSEAVKKRQEAKKAEQEREKEFQKMVKKYWLYRDTMEAQQPYFNGNESVYPPLYVEAAKNLVVVEFWLDNCLEGGERDRQRFNSSLHAR